MRKSRTRTTPKTRKQPRLSRDKLIKTTRKGDIELTEEELGRISGGPTPVELKYPLKV